MNKYENFSLTLPLIRKIQIADPGQEMVNADLKLVTSLIHQANLLGLQGRRVITLEIKEAEKQNGLAVGTTFSLKYEETKNSNG